MDRYPSFLVEYDGFNEETFKPEGREAMKLPNLREKLKGCKSGENILALYRSHQDKCACSTKVVSEDGTYEGIVDLNSDTKECAFLLTFLLELCDDKSVNKSYAKGETILHLLAWNLHGFPEIKYSSICSLASVIFGLGCDVNSQDLNGLTALHVAAMKDLEYIYSSEVLVTFLLQRGADPNLLDNFGYAPYHYAMFTDHKPVINQLQSLTHERYLCLEVLQMQEKKVDPLWSMQEKEDLYQDNLRNAIEVSSSLQAFLYTPGVGLLYDPEEINEMKQQVTNLFENLSREVTKLDPRMKFEIHVAGSVAENTKCGKPEEMDMIMRLVAFETDLWVIEEDESYWYPPGYVRIKCKAENPGDFRAFVDENGYVNKNALCERLYDCVHEAYDLTSVWCGKSVQNLYPSINCFRKARENILELYVEWAGNTYKHMGIKIDCVPAIHFKEWLPKAFTTQTPFGNKVSNECNIIAKAPPKAIPDEIRKIQFSVSSDMQELETMTFLDLPEAARIGYCLAKVMVESLVPAVYGENLIFYNLTSQTYILKTALFYVLQSMFPNNSTLKYGNIKDATFRSNVSDDVTDELPLEDTNTDGIPITSEDQTPEKRTKFSHSGNFSKGNIPANEENNILQESTCSKSTSGTGAKLLFEDITSWTYRIFEEIERAIDADIFSEYFLYERNLLQKLKFLECVKAQCQLARSMLMLGHATYLFKQCHVPEPQNI